MADLTLSANMDTLMQAANFAAARTSLGLGALSTLTPGTGVATALAINVGSAGAVVVLGGALGTPSSGTLTSATGLPISTGLTGAGTGVLTALAVNVGSAGAFVVLGGAAGTPSSIVLTNATGLPTAGLVDAAVTLAKIQNAAANSKLLGSGAAGSGAAYAEITLGTNLSMSGTTLNATGSVDWGGIGGTLADQTDLQTALDAKQATITFGTGVQTALGVNVGSAGAPVLFNGALGTPSSGTVTNLTGTASININGTVGATTPAAGTFTTVVAGSATSLLLGTAGSAVGSVGFRNATSGTITLSPTTGALGTTAIVIPAAAGTIAVAATSVTATQALFATTTAGAPAYRAIAAGDLPSTLTSGTAITNAALTTPTLGTPASGNLSNCTALPASSLTAAVLAANITLGESTGQLVLDPTLSADGTWSGIMQAGTAGATLAFGDLVYFQASDSRWELTDADAEATAGPLLIGMCVLAAASDGDPTNILLYGKIRADAAFPTLTIGAPAYISTTAGDIQVAQPSGTDDVIRVVGHAITADVLLFNPSQDWIVHT